jgi:hypothetical protein
MEAIRLFQARNGVLPMLPFGHNLPMIGHYSDHRSNDQRERSIQLVKQWHECQREIDVEKKERQTQEAKVVVKSQAKKNREMDPSTGSVEYEMSINASSLEGTTEAAAWHLHGQSGGRVAPLPTDKSHFGKHVLVMNSKAMSAMTNFNGVEASLQSKREVRCDIEAGQRSAETNVAIELPKNGDARITSKRNIELMKDETANGDIWSTGVASAIVMGTAARYNKTLFMFPHGRRVLLPLVMSMMALALSVFVSRSCRFISVLPSSSLNQIFQLGPWFYLSTNPQSDEVCMPYPSNIQLDFWFTMARAMSALAVCLGVGLWLWTCTLSCIPYSRSSLSGLGLCFFVASILQLATSFFYLSNNCNGSVDEIGKIVGGGYFGGIECTANQDLVFCIAASALYFATSWLLYIAQGVIANDPGASSSEVFTWSALAKSDDIEKGTRTIEKSWIRIPDGSTLMATVVVERTIGKKGCIKTTHQIKTEILPAT